MNVWLYTLRMCSVSVSVCVCACMLVTHLIITFCTKMKMMEPDVISGSMPMLHFGECLCQNLLKKVNIFEFIL